MLDIKMSSKIVMGGVNVKYKDEFRHLCISYDFNGNLRNVNGKKRLECISDCLFGIGQEQFRELDKLRDNALQHAKELMSTIKVIDIEHVEVTYDNYLLSFLIDEDGFVTLTKILNNENNYIITNVSSVNKFCDNLDSKYLREIQALIKYMIFNKRSTI